MHVDQFDLIYLSEQVIGVLLIASILGSISLQSLFKAGLSLSLSLLHQPQHRHPPPPKPKKKKKEDFSVAITIPGYTTIGCSVSSNVR